MPIRSGQLHSCTRAVALCPLSLGLTLLLACCTSRRYMVGGIADDGGGQEVPLLSLPDDVLTHVFSFLHTHEIVCVLPLVCRRFAKLSADADSWRGAALMYLGAGDPLFSRALSAAPKLAYLKIWNQDHGGRLIRAIETGTRNVRRLSLKIYRDGIDVAVRTLRHYGPFLRSLTIRFMVSFRTFPTELLQEVFREIALLRHLERLRIEGPINYVLPVHLLAPGCPQLVSLDMQDLLIGLLNCDHFDASIAQLLSAKRDNIHSLRLPNSCQRFPMVEDILPKCRQVRSFDMVLTSVRRDLPLLEKLPSLSRLRILISDSFCRSEADSKRLSLTRALRNVSQLDIVDYLAYPNVLGHLVRGCGRLKYLRCEVFRSTVFPTEMDLSVCRDVEFLYLSVPQMWRETVHVIRRYFRKLTHLIVKFSDHVDNNGSEALRELFQERPRLVYDVKGI